MTLPDDVVVELVERAEGTGCELVAALAALPEVREARRRVEALRVIDRLVTEGMSVRSAVAFLARQPGFPYPAFRLRRWHTERAKSLQGGLPVASPEHTVEVA